MPNTRSYLFVVTSLIAVSLQADPVRDFCRRWNHQTAVVDGRLYIDGGQVAYNSLAYDYTNDFLVFSDLKSRTTDGFPQQHNNLSKPANVPSLSGAYLWADEVNKCFYQFGGAFPEADTPEDFGMWTYDVLLNQWNRTNYVSNNKNLQRPSFGAGTQIDSRGLGFYYGGWLSNRTSPGWKSSRMALSSLLRFDFTTGDLRNNTHPDGIGRAEGQMMYLPVSDGGLLVYFGGIEDTYRNGSYTAANMNKIHIYDVNSEKWYSQTATGDIPLARRQFCAGVTWPADRSSFNIYLYGGYGFGDPAAFDDVYILSLPSFKWMKGYPLGASSNQFGHGGCSASIMNPNQMMVIGGWFSNQSFVDCDAPNSQGQHNMVLGNNTGKQENGIWDKYDPKLSSYVVPTMIIDAIGGGPTGGAQVTAPSTWDNNDVKVYYQIKLTSVTRMATRILPATGSPTSERSPKKTNVGAIAGGTVGGLAVLIVILGLVLFCLHRRKKAKKTGGQNVPSAPPAELDVTSIPHEMSTSGASKYVAAHERPYPNELPAYSGLGAPNAGAGNYDHSTLHASYPTQYGSPEGTGQGHLSNSPLRSPNNTGAYIPTRTSSSDAQQGTWYPQSGLSPQLSNTQRQHSCPSPTTPQHATPTLPQEPQPYYPPPQAADSINAIHEDYRDSPKNTQYRDEPQYNVGMGSTSATPAQFYSAHVSTTGGDFENGTGQGGWNNGHGRTQDRRM
ncbi:hypothetical protein DE146DRAFT_160791 [Phaeosphaeria sp. MPI-PUGE-AT-0046c]|nr:hypothetical protein DE146DRAFT_160791 [Phaeosphaeria sp. MPI-PUGE-AT-0046c]